MLDKEAPRLQPNEQQRVELMTAEKDFSGTSPGGGLAASFSESFNNTSSTLLQGDPNISNNMNSLIFKAVQDFITQSSRFAME